MNILRIFVKASPIRVWLSLLFAMASGVFYALLIPIVVSYLVYDDKIITMSNEMVKWALAIDISNLNRLLTFFGACFLAWVFRSYSQMLLIDVYTEIKADLRVRLYDKVCKQKCDKLGNENSEDFTSMIYDHLSYINVGATATPYLAISIIVLISSISFLFLIKPVIVLVILISVVVCTAVWEFAMSKGVAKHSLTTGSEKRLKEMFSELLRKSQDSENTESTLELKKQLLVEEKKIILTDKSAHRILMPTHSFSELICPLIVGFVCFVCGDYLSLTIDESVSIIIAVLLIFPPLRGLLSYLPQLSMASNSYKSFNALLDDH